MPVVVVAILYGDAGTAKLLVLSQVVLSMQLPFAVIPLMLFATDRPMRAVSGGGLPARLFREVAAEVR